MRKVYKKVSGFIIIVLIICGFRYINGNISIYSSNNKDKLVEVANANGNEKILLVNDKYGLSGNYVPEELSIPNILFSNGSNDEEKHVARTVVKPLEELVKAGKKDGIILLGNSGYRSYKSQEDIYKNRVISQGKKLADAYVAKPGFSEHQTGLCIDITNKNGYFAKGSKEADWLADNCYRFGFIIRYPYGKKNITGIEYEPWHIRYVGKEVAKYIHDNRITLEEYLQR